MINFILWIIVGALIGWAASMIMHTNGRQGPIGDILVGMVGAFVGGYFLSPLFHVDTFNDGNFSIATLLVSLGGVITLLALFKLFHNIARFLVVILVGPGIYLYFNCWTMESTTAYCGGLKALPFLQ